MHKLSMRQPLRGEMPILLTLPLKLEWRPRGRRRRGLRRAVIAALATFGAALLATGFWMPAKAALAQQLLNRAWTASRDARRDVRPWPWADTWPVARLHLPTADAALTVLAGASGRALAFGPALMDGSAMPGTTGVSVIAGHRDTHFRALESLAIGDRFELERPDGGTFAYEVTALDVIDGNREMLRLDADESVVALVTCWPFEALAPGGSLRYVVTGRLAASR
jgi:sortase A